MTGPLYCPVCGITPPVHWAGCPEQRYTTCNNINAGRCIPIQARGIMGARVVEECAADRTLPPEPRSSDTDQQSTH